MSRADERPDPVAQDAQLVGEDGCGDEADRHEDHRNEVVGATLRRKDTFLRWPLPEGPGL